MGRKSRTKWDRRRAALLELPGSLGMMVRSILLFERPAHRRQKKTVPVRNAFWLRDQHLAGGKWMRQFELLHRADGDFSTGVHLYPQFPSVAAMLEHFKAEEKTLQKEP